MGTPNVTDNYRGYEDSDLSKKAMRLDKKLLMLIHGSADEIVHYQHSMMLIRALTEKGILFRHQVRCLVSKPNKVKRKIIYNLLNILNSESSLWLVKTKTYPVI